jgi:D-alanyl-D-alanine carboxypeptidase
VQGLSIKVTRWQKTSSLGLIVVIGLLGTGSAIPVSAQAGGARLSPEFALSLAELQATTQSLPEEIRVGILATPQEFLHLVAGALDEPADFFVLVDKSHALASDFQPEDLVNLKTYALAVSIGDIFLRKAIMPAVLELAASAKKSRITLLFSSGYRSFEYQKYVLAREVKTYGQEMADRESARPGASQHQLGTAIDFGSITDDFAVTRAGRWLAEHAWEHGFSLSYPQGYEAVTGYRYESWHYRYVTKLGTLLQRKYFGDIQQYMLEFLNENRAALESKRR